MLGHKAYMKVEIELTPVSAMHETLELAQMVDQFGAERLGISDVVLSGIKRRRISLSGKLFFSRKYDLTQRSHWRSPDHHRQ